MSVLKTLFGTTRVIPETDETGWGAEVTNLLVDLTDGVNALISATKETGKLTSANTSLPAGGTLTQTAGRHYIQGDVAPVTLSASNAIADGSEDGKYLELVGASNTNTVTILDGSNVSFNGDITLALNEILELRWSAATGTWMELSRNN